MTEESSKHKYYLESEGLISRNLVKSELCHNNNEGINFISFSKPDIKVGANFSNINSTQRNTVLAKDGQFICLTEHFLAACSLMNVNHVNLGLSEDELPFGDGSAKLWVDFFQNNNLGGKIQNSSIKLKEEILVQDGDRYIKAVPAENFKVTYELDWDHPKVGKQDFTWSLNDDVYEIANARTFSNELENKMLGLDGWIVGLTEDGFSMPLLFDNEPARHKALDLVGDLYLSGINPLDIRMHITSHKGGHELNSKMAKALSEKFSKKVKKNKSASIVAAIMICFFSFFSPVKAEDFSVKISGSQLKDLSALELKFTFEPTDSLRLGEDFYLKDTKTHFKTVDMKNSIIRMFFAEELKEELTIIGAFNRKNFKGKPNVSIEEINYISKLGTEIVENDFKTELSIQKGEEVLPFVGIVKANILGPEERIFQNKMFIAITDVETYGFDFNKSVKNIRINNNKAKFLNENIVVAMINLDSIPFDKELAITLELEVGDKHIKKTIGLIKLLESLSS